MRRLLPARLLALFLACSGIVLQPPPASACSCAVSSTRAQSEHADTVLVGALADIRISTEEGQTAYTVDVARRYKGREVAGTIEVESPSGGAACGLEAMVVDEDYVFFLRRTPTGYRAGLCDGTGPADAKYVKRVERLLGTGARVTEPTAAEFTPVEDAEPMSFTRLAAPGAALVLVGLLGLILVRALGRDR